MANMMLGKTDVRPNRPRDGRHCDLCGCSQPAVRCDKCGCQIFCLSCDDMYHRHPKRRFHLRKAVDPTPPTTQARPVLPMKIANLPTSPGDPSKMPLPPPRKKKPGKSFFDTFRRRSPSSEQNSPPLPKKEYSWTDRLGNIKKFMSNRPLPPLPDTNGHEHGSDMQQNSQFAKHDLSFIHKRVEERPPQLPQRSLKPNEISRDKENFLERSPGNNAVNMRNGAMDPSLINRRLSGGEENNWDNRFSGNPQLNTLNRQNPQGFFPSGGPGFPGNLTNNMHQSSSAADLQNLNNMDGYPGQGMQHPHYPHYPMNPHMPHFPYPMYPPQYPNYPQYFGNSFANLSNQPTTTDGDFSDQSEASSRHHSGKKYPFRKRAKRSQSVMVDRMAYPGQFYPFGPFPPGYGPGPWGGAPFPAEAPPSPASSVRSLNRIGRTRRRKKMTSDDDEELSMSSSPLSRPKSSSSERHPPLQKKAPIATQTTSEEESEEEMERERNKGRNEKQPLRRDSDPSKQPIRRTSDPRRMPSLVPKSPQFHHKKVSKQKQREVVKHSDSEELPSSPTKNDRRPSRDSNTDQNDQDRPPTIWVPTSQWQCNHCTFINPSGNRICQVCCKTASPDMVTLMTSRPTSAAGGGSRKQSLSSEQSSSSPEKKMEEDDSIHTKRGNKEMEVLNSALDEAEEEINRGLKELMKLKEDFLPSKSPADTSHVQQPEPAVNTEDTSAKTKPVYKSSGKMRTSILDKLNIQTSKQPAKSTASTSTETQTGPSKMDRIIEARRASTSSSISDAYNSPTAQSPQLERTVVASGVSKTKSSSRKESACQTQTDDLMGYLERKKVEEDAYFGRMNNGHGLQYGDRMDTITSPVPAMYDRGFGGGYGMMQRSHSRASLFTGRMNDLGPMDYGLGPAPMYRSVSRSSLTGDYSENRFSEFHNLRKPDYYLSMEELVERRRQESIRAQGLELVRMIREAEQQGFTADDIQVALTNCGTQNPMEWLQENWRNMVENVISLSTSYANDKKENDIGTLSENEARDALRMHKGNVWAAVTECVESRQRKFLELKARGKFNSKDITDALTASQGDVEASYAKLTKSTSKPFLMRIWGAGEGVPNQDGAMPMANDTFRPQSDRYAKDNTDLDDVLSDEVWDEDYEEDVDWEEDSDEPDEGEEQGDLEDLRTCHDDLCVSDEIKTPESDSEYADAFGSNTLERNVSSPFSDTFFVIPEIKQEKKGTGLLSKLAALRKEDRGTKQGRSKFYDSDLDISSPEAQKEVKDDSSQDCVSLSDQTKTTGPFSVIKNTISAIRDSVSVLKSEKKLPCATPERRTIIVKGQIAHESLSDDKDSSGVKLISAKPLKEVVSSAENTNYMQKGAVPKHSKSSEEVNNTIREPSYPEETISGFNKDLKSKSKDSATNLLKEVDAPSFIEEQIVPSSKGSEPSKSQSTELSFQKQSSSILSQTASVPDKENGISQNKIEEIKAKQSTSEGKSKISPHKLQREDDLNLKLKNNSDKSPNDPDSLEVSKEPDISENISKHSNINSKDQSPDTQTILPHIKDEKAPGTNTVLKMENKKTEKSLIPTQSNKNVDDPKKVKFKFLSGSTDVSKCSEKDKALSNKNFVTDSKVDAHTTSLDIKENSQIAHRINSPTNVDFLHKTPESSTAGHTASDVAVKSNKFNKSPPENDISQKEPLLRVHSISQVESDGENSKQDNQNVPSNVETSSRENIQNAAEGNLEACADTFATSKNENSEQTEQKSLDTHEASRSTQSTQHETKIENTASERENEIPPIQNFKEIQDGLASNDNGFTECPPVKSVIKDVDTRQSLISGTASSSISSLKTETIDMGNTHNVKDVPSVENEQFSSKPENASTSLSTLHGNNVETNSLSSDVLPNSVTSSISENIVPSGELRSSEQIPTTISTTEEDNNSTQLQASSSGVAFTPEKISVLDPNISTQTSNEANVLQKPASKEIEPISEQVEKQITQENSAPIPENIPVTNEMTKSPIENKRNTSAKPKLKLVKLSKKESELSNDTLSNTGLPSTSEMKDSSKSAENSETNHKENRNVSDKALETASQKSPSVSATEIYPPSLVEVIKKIPVASSQPIEQSLSTSEKSVSESQDGTDHTKCVKEQNVVSVSPVENIEPTIGSNKNDQISADKNSTFFVQNELNFKETIEQSNSIPPASSSNQENPQSPDITTNIEKPASELNSNSDSILTATLGAVDSPTESPTLLPTASTSKSIPEPTIQSTSPTSGPVVSPTIPLTLPPAETTYKSIIETSMQPTSTNLPDTNSATPSDENQQHSKKSTDNENASAKDTKKSFSESTDSTSDIPEKTKNTSQTSENVSIEDGTKSESDDEESSDDSVSPPNPIDLLRYRFEGLMDASPPEMGPVRPQSPYRRMSFRSRKAAIALERTRDTSTEKPWFLPKLVPEVKKTVPKRSVKQQLEIDRRVRKMVADRKCRTYRKAEIVVQLIDMNFEEDEALQAANDCSTLEQAISYLQQECLLCTGNFPVSHIISMVHCAHKACRGCLRAYFTVQIRDRNIMELLCPFCNEPDIFDEDIAQDYFNHLDIMLKKLIDPEIHELFQRKLRDRVLMRDPNFKWCSQCSSGFIAMPNLKRLVCPDCNAVSCAACRRPWEKEHQGISCEAFAAWKDAADPEAQTVSLAKLLTEDGIDCPRCHFRYALAKGGCMHFRCTQCQHDFCSGCSKPFKMGQKCGVSEFCAKLGLHAHHPRNCLFYLRDKEPEDLQRLLDLSEVKYDKDAPDKLDTKSACQVMEQKETADGMLDDYCGKDVEEGFAGLCRLHYVEYLGQLVNKHKVDPIQIFEKDDLELVLRRANIRLPPKRYRETDDQYKEKLIKLIQEELPLDRVEGS